MVLALLFDFCCKPLSFLYKSPEWGYTREMWAVGRNRWGRYIFEHVCWYASSPSTISSTCSILTQPGTHRHTSDEHILTSSMPPRRAIPVPQHLPPPPPQPLRPSTIPHLPHTLNCSIPTKNRSICSTALPPPSSTITSKSLPRVFACMALTTRTHTLPSLQPSICPTHWTQQWLPPPDMISHHSLGVQTPQRNKGFQTDTSLMSRGMRIRIVSTILAKTTSVRTF